MAKVVAGLWRAGELVRVVLAGEEGSKDEWGSRKLVSRAEAGELRSTTQASKVEAGELQMALKAAAFRPRPVSLVPPLPPRTSARAQALGSADEVGEALMREEVGEESLEEAGVRIQVVRVEEERLRGSLVVREAGEVQVGSRETKESREEVGRLAEGGRAPLGLEWGEKGEEGGKVVQER